MTDKTKEETLRRKQRRRQKLGEEVDINNPVAKHMGTFNKPKRHADLSKDHARKDRYKRWKFGEDDED